MAGRYAQDTDVPVERSKAQIEQLLRAHGAERYASGWTREEDRIEFSMAGVRIRFTLPRPRPEDHETTSSGRARPKGDIARHVAKLERQRWRALQLVVRAKLEAVESGMAVFEQEFLAFVVTPWSDRTVGDILVPRLQAGDLRGGLKQLADGKITKEG
jgi:hypothetical protein